MTLEMKSISFVQDALSVLEEGFVDLPPFDPSVDLEHLRAVLLTVAEKMRDNFPYPHPFYLGQMLKPPHPIARLAYMLSLWINPNNHALDGGRASSAMEKESVSEIARMFGWNTHLGHLTSGGTMANLEGLWVSGRLHPGKHIVASQQAHYTHKRISAVLGIPFREVPCDHRARMRVDALEAILKEGNVGTVVVTVGTTATGSVDPLVDVLNLQERYGFRIHADCAYGGYFILADGLRPETRAVFDHLTEVDSLVIDPHKHGLQPYGCGCVIFKDPSVGRLYKHESPYTYFTSHELHLGEISLECSRPGSSAVALWATQRMLPLVPRGKFAEDLGKCRSAALRLCDLLDHDPRFVTAFAPELDIVVWVPKADSASRASQISETLFQEAAGANIHMAKANLPKLLFESRVPEMQWDRDQITCLRTCLMKPEHLEWMERIWTAFDETAERVLRMTENG
ncbi:MAG TPA: aminotransferase class I/II-fold pyridoxal phosphate-dependent enzyme [Desulfomonilaceae bacterium]|nr:aminotransferase class I/II-fold pyridoxal phosphate-dependent enzyme [Desulfomonilaceae bacterium]